MTIPILMTMVAAWLGVCVAAVAHLHGGPGDGHGRTPATTARRMRWKSAYRAVVRLAAGTGPGGRFDDLLRRSGLRVDVVQAVLLLPPACAVAFLVVDVLLVPQLAVAAAVFAPVGVVVWLRRRARLRRELLIAQLPDLAACLANAAAAGLSLRVGLEVAARQASPPLAPELRVVVDRIALGDPVERALQAFADRSGSREVALLVGTIALQIRAGGDMIAALRAMVSVITARADARREALTAMAGARSNALGVPAVGLVLVVMYNHLIPGALEAMVTSPVGLLILVVASGLVAAGVALTGRLARVRL